MERLGASDRDLKDQNGGGVFEASDRDPTAPDARSSRLELVGYAEGLGLRGEKREREA